MHAGRLEAELLSVTKRATTVAQMLPRNVTPVNLEVLRRLKLALVELESKAASLRFAGLDSSFGPIAVTLSAPF